MDIDAASSRAVRRGTVVATHRQGWPRDVVADFDAAVTDVVGNELVGRTGRSRIWTLRLAPGEHFPVHRHRRSYLWFATSAGRARQHLSNGDTRVVDYLPGDHELTVVGDDCAFDHDIENIGTDELTFVTIELETTAATVAPAQVDELRVPASHADLLTSPLFGHLATIRPDGSPQSSVMWFDWDGKRLRFTHTTGRQKTRNLRYEPRVSVHIQDPDAPYRTLEIRGVVESIEPDTDAAFYRALQHRYGKTHPVYDADQRVVITVAPTRFIPVDGGLTPTEQRRLHDLLEQLADRGSPTRGR